MSKFKVGDKVYSKHLNREGEIVAIDRLDMTSPYLVGVKGYEGHSGGKFVFSDIKLDIERKGYANQCIWQAESMLELVKEDKEMPKIKVEDIRGPQGIGSDPVGSKPEMVNHPQHYAFKYEPIDVINDWGLDFNLGNTVKYIARCERKGNKIQDLEKAKFYLEDEIRRLKENNG